MSDRAARDALVPSTPPPFARDVGPGCIWPAPDGRELLARVGSQPLILCEQLQHRRGTDDGSGGSATLVYRAGAYCAKTSTTRWFSTLERGREALVAQARRKRALGRQLVPETALVLQGDAVRGFWLWTLTPWLQTLRSAMNEAHQAAAENVLGGALSLYADAWLQALVLTLERGLSLDVHPSNFVMSATSDEVFYIDEEIDDRASVAIMGHALLQRVEEYADRPRAVGVYLDAVEQRLARTLTPDQARACHLAELFEGVISRRTEAAAARARLCAFAERFARGAR